MLTLTVLLAVCCIGALSAQKFPLSPSQRCNLVAQGGKACRPDACQNATCKIFPDAVCFSDRCGCRAQFYQFVKEENAFVCVTKLCQAATEMEASQNLMRKVLSKDDASMKIIAKNPAFVDSLFKGSSSFGKELLQSIVGYLKKLAEQEPSDANLQRYQTALGKLNGTIAQTANNATMSDTNDIELGLADYADPEEGYL